MIFLTAVAITSGAAALTHNAADGLAFVASAVGSRACLPFPSQQQQQDGARIHSATPQRQTSRLRPRCGWGWDCPTLLSEPASFSFSFSPSRHRHRRRQRQRQRPRSRQHIVAASSSGLQEQPLERFAGAATSTSAQHSEDAAGQRAWLPQRQQATAAAAAAAAGESERRQQAWREGLGRAHPGGGGGAAAATAGEVAGVGSDDAACDDRDNGGSIYREGGEEEEKDGKGSNNAGGLDGVDYGFDFEDEEDVDIYLPGGMGAGLKPGLKPRKSKPPAMWSKPVKKDNRFRVVLAGRGDLDEAGALCIRVFFGQPDSPWKAAQLRQLTKEQGQDLESRCNRKESVMFKAIDTRRKNAMVGFVEVSETSGTKYGMGSGVPVADTRPVVSNLAVDPQERRSGVGTALMEACEDLVKTWNLEEIILQVEEDNEAALAFYGGMGFNSLFVDRAARRYDTSGFLLQNVRTSKITMRKALDLKRGTPRPGDTLGHHVAHLLGFLAKPFVVRPPPYTRLPARSAASVENLFGPPGGGGSVARRKRGSTGGRVGSSSGRAAAEAGQNNVGTGGDPSLFTSSSSSSSPSEEIPPVRLLRTTRRR
ncbi:unnamed protein product [Pylaiella littoralis]